MLVGIQPDIFIFIGLPGCGKSTFGKMLAEKRKLGFYEMSDLIDEELQRSTIKARQIFGLADKEIERQKQRKKDGYNCDNDFVCKLVIGKLLGYSSGLVLCGFPRDEDQAQRLVDFTKNIGVRNRIIAILPKITDGTSIERMTKKLTLKEREIIVPEFVQARFENIKKDFNRVVSVLGKNKIEVITLNAMQSSQKVFDDMLKAIPGP